MEFKGTKGEWKQYCDMGFTTIETDTAYICDVDCGEEEHGLANAKLIASAPELLEALIEAYRCSGERNHLTKPVLDLMKQAINKAIK